MGASKSVPDRKILMNGLDAAGKTTMLYTLKVGEVVTTIPTIGFIVETLEHKDVSITCWDVGGRDKIRPLWRHYYQNTNGVIWMVDCNDHDRVQESLRELITAMQEDTLARVPVLVFANKQDLPNAFSDAELTDKFGMHTAPEFRTRKWHVQSCCCKTGAGISQGLAWLNEAIDEYKKSASSW